jgi:hypothetical protein
MHQFDHRVAFDAFAQRGEYASRSASGIATGHRIADRRDRGQVWN